MLLQFIYNIPNFELLIILAGINIVISLIVLCLVRRYIPIETRLEFNDGLGFIAATTGVIYAILIGLIAVSVVANFDKAQGAANDEADTIAAIYHLSNNLSGSIRKNIQNLTELYLNTVINEEWDYMRQGKPIPNIDTINKLNLLVAQYKGQSLRESLTLDKLNENINVLYNAHKEREKWSITSVHPDVMIVLILGTIFVILAHLLMGIDFKLHIISIIILDIVIASILFLVIAVDHPFMGKISIQPEAFQVLLQRIHAGTV